MAEILARHSVMGGGDPEERVRESMAEGAEIAAEFPYLRTRLRRSGADYNEAPDDTFECGLSCLLDGFAVQVAGREAGAN